MRYIQVAGSHDGHENGNHLGDSDYYGVALRIAKIAADKEEYDHIVIYTDSCTHAIAFWDRVKGWGMCEEPFHGLDFDQDNFGVTENFMPFEKICEELRSADVENYVDRLGDADEYAAFCDWKSQDTILPLVLIYVAGQDVSLWSWRGYPPQIGSSIKVEGRTGKYKVYEVIWQPRVGNTLTACVYTEVG